jgi:DNA-binding IclR family transcriptional regulator
MSLDYRRSPQLQRAIDLVRLLAQEALTLDQIAAKLGVSERTIRRDLYALHIQGVGFLNVAMAESADDADDWPIAARAAFGGPAVILKLDLRSWTALLYQPAEGQMVARQGGAR